MRLFVIFQLIINGITALQANRLQPRHVKIVFKDSILDLALSPTQSKIKDVIEPSKKQQNISIGEDFNYKLITEVGDEVDIVDRQELIFGNDGGGSVIGSLRGDLNEVMKKVAKLEENDIKQVEIINQLTTRSLYLKYMYVLRDLNDFKKLEKKNPYISRHSRHSRHTFRKLGKDRNKYAHCLLEDTDSLAVKEYKLQLFKDKWLNMPDKVYNLLLSDYKKDFMNDITNYFLSYYNTTNTNTTAYVTSTGTLEQDVLESTQKWFENWWSLLFI